MPEWKLAPSEKVTENSDVIARFLARVDPKGEPLFISDDSSLLEIHSSAATAEELREVIGVTYGVGVTEHELLQPLWQLALRFEGPDSS